MYLTKVTTGKAIIAIDPDSNKSGVAKIVKGEVVDVFALTLIQLDDYLSIHDSGKTVILIENVERDKCVYRRGETRPGVLTNIGMKVGMVKMQYRNICALADKYGYKVFPVGPLAKASPYISKAKKDAEFFKRLTGYVGKTNEEKRDAIMIGLYGPQQVKELN